MAEEKKPVPFRENWLASHPPHQHPQRYHHGNQQERVCGFPIGISPILIAGCPSQNPQYSLFHLLCLCGGFFEA
jgi:hypothetical protein